MSHHEVVLLLGSNLGKPEHNIALAIAKIEASLGKVVATTQPLRTEPTEFVSSNYFCNIALRLKTRLSPVGLLEEIKIIEQSMGGLAASMISKEYVCRVIAIDIVKLGNNTFSSACLQMPHHKHTQVRDSSRQLPADLQDTE